MNLKELVDRTHQRLDENTLYYTLESVIRDGINPAQRLLAMTKVPLTRRVATAVSAESSVVDLRLIAPRLWKMRRVVLGTITGDDPSTTMNQYRNLLPTKVESLTWKRDWFLRRGDIVNYWVFGDQWLGVYPRPSLPVDLTLIFDAMPLPFVLADLDTAPDPELPPVWHHLISEIALALLIIKEGVAETTKAEQILQQSFSSEITRGLRRVLNTQPPVADGVPV